MQYVVFVIPYLQPLHLLFHGNAVKGFISLCKNFEVLPRATQPISEGPESILRLCDALRLLLELSEGLLNDKRENLTAHCQERSFFSIPACSVLIDSALHGYGRSLLGARS